MVNKSTLVEKISNIVYKSINEAMNNSGFNFDFYIPLLKKVKPEIDALSENGEFVIKPGMEFSEDLRMVMLGLYLKYDESLESCGDGMEEEVVPFYGEDLYVEDESILLPIEIDVYRALVNAQPAISLSGNYFLTIDNGRYYAGEDQTYDHPGSPDGIDGFDVSLSERPDDLCISDDPPGMKYVKNNMYRGIQYDKGNPTIFIDLNFPKAVDKVVEYVNTVGLYSDYLQDWYDSYYEKELEDMRNYDPYDYYDED